MLDYEVVIKPVVTEKTSAAYGARKEYAFRAHPKATKHQIKEAIEQLFDVRVLKVRTMQQRAKIKTMGRTKGLSTRWKKAYVTLHEDDSIEVFEG
ncbi:MAG: 50S ribosomal protein L23 [Gemmatimonadota bacterium]|nr:MAG: 50S ribosomal protein L23 [Gemmatimonadota bacterium]